MRIVSSSIELASAHRFEARSRVREQVFVRALPSPDVDTFHGTGHGSGPDAIGDRRDAAKLARLLDRYFDSRPGSEKSERLAERIDRLVKRIDARIAADHLTGREGGGDGGDGATADVRGLVELRYRREERYREREAMSFRATGSVTTADGRQIDFRQALELARVYARTETISLRAAVQIGTPASGAVPPAEQPSPVPALGSAATAAEGASEPDPSEASTAQTNRAALSVAGGVVGLDADGDGTIDLATELVGGTGNGFAELARYDDDGNGFIDEGDEAFGRLAIVRPGEDGNTATSFAAAGVGALYLGSVATPYTVRDASGQVNGQLARSGIYLNENGTTGIAHQVNVVI
ncbi:MAG: hypothetical protein ACKVZ0_10340 [Gemmatimonadales bacterium]